MADLTMAIAILPESKPEIAEALNLLDQRVRTARVQWETVSRWEVGMQWFLERWQRYGTGCPSCHEWYFSDEGHICPR